MMLLKKASMRERGGRKGKRWRGDRRVVRPEGHTKGRASEGCSVGGR
jgi:hypothetical protein